MNKFWKSVIFPIIKAANSKNLVEIGCGKGENTKNIIKYCLKYRAKLTIIDPLPMFDVGKWGKMHKDFFEYHEELSLNALPLIKDYDTVLIDGDHNWYTVYNELKIIEKDSKGKSFPLVFLHDVGWPYGRRDLYYNPDNIPSGYRQPYEKKGIFPGESSLVKEGGLNSNLNNATIENNNKNGVLTAIEDFLSETKYNLTFIKINVFHGLGIIIDKQYSELITYAQNLSKSVQLIDEVEKDRIIKDIENHDLRKKSHNYIKKIYKIKREVERLMELI